MKFLRLLYAFLVALAVVAVACGSDQAANVPDTSLDGGLADASKADANKPDGASATDGGDGGTPVPPPTFSVGGTVVGLFGTGLVLQNNAGDDLAIGANGAFQFSKKALSGAPFAVTIKTQPTAPTQTCTISGGSGTIANGNVTSVTVNCSTNTFTVGGTVTGLVGSGLVLENNAGDALVVNANGSFAFATAVASGATYAVTVKTQPNTPSQTCTVTSGTGTIAAAEITDVTVTCTTNQYTVGGTVTALAGTGLVLKLGAEELPIPTNGNFTFVTPIASGADYAVSIVTQPTNPSQTCTVLGGSGTVGGANVTSVVVNCDINKFIVSGTVSGIAGTAVLQNNGTDNLPVAANGTFAFPTPLDSGATYSVTVLTQPGTPSQTCTVTNGSGTIDAENITNVVLTCVTNTFKVKGTVTGLSGTGLILTNSGADDLTVPGNGAFEFATPVASGQTYVVAVKTNPTGPSQTCTVTNSTGTVAAADIANVAINCIVNKYTVSGTVTGLTGAGLVLQNNGGDNYSVSANGPFTFATSVESGKPYVVTVSTQPTSPTQTCTVSAGSGTVTNGNVVDITVNCATNSYVIGGTVTGLVGTGLVLQNNGGDNITVNNNGTFAFPVTILSGQPYAVTVFTQPTNPHQTCAVTSGTGTVGGSDVSVSVSCTTNSYVVSATVSGLAGSGLVLRNNGGNNLSINSNGTFNFSSAVLSGQPYAVTVFTQPSSPSQTCTVTSGSGTVAGSNVNVSVSCTTNSYVVSATVSGLAGTGLVLQNNGGNNLSISGNGTFNFSSAVLSGQPYAVTVLTQPSALSQTCTVTSGSGTVTNANVNVSVSCTTNSYVISAAVSGLSGTLVLQNNGGNNLTVTTNGNAPFTTPILSGQAYAVTVLTQPANQLCSVTSGTGTVAGSNVSVTVSCVNTYSISATVSGLTGTAVLRNNGGDDLSANGNGTFTFATRLTSGQPYNVTVLSTPANYTCTVSNGSGNVASANITNVTVSCVFACTPTGSRAAFNSLTEDTATGCWSGNPCAQNNVVFQASDGQNFQSFGQAISCTGTPTCVSHVGIGTYFSGPVCQGIWNVYCDNALVGTINTVNTACTGTAMTSGCQITFAPRLCSTIRYVAAADADGTSFCCGGSSPDSMISATAAW